MAFLKNDSKKVPNGTPLVRALDKKAKSYLKAFQRSLSSSALDRAMAAEEDMSAMTIDFLRARLKAQRVDYRAEKQRAQVLVQKILELEHKLSIETHLRKQAESGLVDASFGHEHEALSPHYPFPSSMRVEAANEEHQQSYGKSKCRITSSTSSPEDFDGRGFNKGEEGGTFIVPSCLQDYSHGRGSSCSYFKEKSLFQCPRHLSHGSPCTCSDKEFFNARISDHKRIRELLPGRDNGHAIYIEQGKSSINAMEKKCRKQGREEEEANKASQYESFSQLQGSDCPQQERKPLSLSVESKEDSSLPICNPIRLMSKNLQPPFNCTNKFPLHHEISEIVEEGASKPDIVKGEVSIHEATCSFNRSPCYNNQNVETLGFSDKSCKPPHQRLQANFDNALERPEKVFSMAEGKGSSFLRPGVKHGEKGGDLWRMHNKVRSLTKRREPDHALPLHRRVLLPSSRRVVPSQVLELKEDDQVLESIYSMAEMLEMLEFTNKPRLKFLDEGSRHQVLQVCPSSSRFPAEAAQSKHLGLDSTSEN